jgi:hypothetical protein
VLSPFLQALVELVVTMDKVKLAEDLEAVRELRFFESFIPIPFPFLAAVSMSPGCL